MLAFYYSKMPANLSTDLPANAFYYSKMPANL